MPLIKYVGNGDPTEGTDAIRLENGEGGQERVLVLGGDPVEVSGQEASSLGGRYILKEANKDGSLKEESESQSPQVQEQPASGQSVSSSIVNPTRPGQGS